MEITQRRDYEKRLALNIFEQFLTTSKVKLANDQCFESFMGEFSPFVINKESIKNVHKLISNVVLSFKGDAEKFYPVFYKCISDAENLFGGSLNKHASLLLLGFELWRIMFLAIYLVDLLKKTRLSNLNIVLQI